MACSSSNLSACLIVNRRPIEHVVPRHGADVSLVEDTLDATVGYDKGFLTQPAEATTQSVRRIVQLPPADAAARDGRHRHRVLQQLRVAGPRGAPG